MAMELVAVRIQDITNQKWYNWDNGAWDANGTPKCKPGGRYYAAAYLLNNGEYALATICIYNKDTGQQLILSKSEFLNSGEGLGTELNETNGYQGYQPIMPINGNMNLRIQTAMPLSNFDFSITPTTSNGSGDNTLLIAGGIGAALLIIGATAYAFKSKK